MQKKTWKQKSLEIIHEYFTDIKKEYPLMSDAEIVKMISQDYYPFGVRSNHPYQAWLKAVNEYKSALKIPTKRAKENDAGCPLFNEFVR